MIIKPTYLTLLFSSLLCLTSCIQLKRKPQNSFGYTPFEYTKKSRLLDRINTKTTTPNKKSVALEVVKNVTFKKNSQSRGTWTGLINGKGPVELFLNISDGSRIIERRFMGGTTLKGRPSSFEFESEVPKMNSWMWTVSLHRF